MGKFGVGGMDLLVRLNIYIYIYIYFVGKNSKVITPTFT